MSLLLSFLIFFKILFLDHYYPSFLPHFHPLIILVLCHPCLSSSLSFIILILYHPYPLPSLCFIILIPQSSIPDPDPHPLLLVIVARRGRNQIHFPPNIVSRARAPNNALPPRQNFKDRPKRRKKNSPIFPQNGVIIKSILQEFAGIWKGFGQKIHQIYLDRRFQYHKNGQKAKDVLLASPWELLMLLYSWNPFALLCNNIIFVCMFS